MRTKSVLYVSDYKARISVGKGNLQVRVEGRTTKVPVHGVEAIVLFGGQMTTESIDLCVRSGIRVAALRRSGRLRFVVGGPTGGNVLLRVAQVQAATDEARTARIARVIVAAKLRSYRALVMRWATDAAGLQRRQLDADADILAERVRALPAAVTGDHIRGIEGDGTRRYFRALGGVLADSGSVGSFLVRSRRPPRDPVNALLSFLYALALAELVGAAEAVGLDPQVGFLHRLRPGRPSLALDLLEELRPTTDRLAVRLLRRRQIRIEHFDQTSAGACYLADHARAAVLNAYEAYKDGTVVHPLVSRPVERWSLPTLQATLLARHLRGDLADYPPFSFT